MPTLRFAPNGWRPHPLLSIAAAMALAIVPAARAQPPAARPGTIELLPGVARLDNITYDAGVPADVTKPASGSGRFAVSVAGGATVSKDGATFKNLIVDAQGRLQGVVITLGSPTVAALAPGCTLELGNGEATISAPGKLQTAAPAKLTLPFRNSDGSAVTCTVKAVRSALTGETGELVLEDVALTGKAAAEGLRFPGVEVRPSPCTFAASWGKGPLAWTLRFPKVDLALALPGLPTDSDLPLEAKSEVKGLAVDQDGQVSFEDAKLTADRFLRPIALPGMELKIREGRVSMIASVPSFSGVKVDLTLPSCVTDAQNKPARVLGLGLDLSGDGPLMEISQRLDLRCGPLKLDLRKFTLDLSGLGAPLTPGVPALVKAPGWTGLWLQDGDIDLPSGQGGAGALKLSLKDFVIDCGGLSGKVSTTFPSCKMEGFTLGDARAEIELRRNQLLRGGVSGKIDLPGLGSLSSRFEFSANWQTAFTVDARSTLTISELGLTLQQLKARMAKGRISLSGTLGFNPPAGMEVPEGITLGQIYLSISDFQIDPSGKLYLPAGGRITMPEPVVIDLQAFEAEIRSIGFTSKSNRLTSISFSGAGRLKNEIPGLPIGGELDFEGLTISAPSGAVKVPTLEIGGLGVAADIPQVGQIKATLGLAKNVNGFRSALYGGAELRLTCLGEAGGTIGGGLSLLVAAEQGAWFVGGRAEFPPILIQIPPAPPPVPSPIPLFNICGFAGGFGMNVAPVGPGEGPIIVPVEQLKHSEDTILFQMGLLLADPLPVPGKLWWGDVTLTGTFDPVTIDLTGRVALMDIEAAPRWLGPSEFAALDRNAKACMNIDFEKGVFLLGAEADLCFPMRKKSGNLIQVSGQGTLKLSPQGMSMHIGWKDAGQKPLSVVFAKAIEDKLDISAKAGLKAVVQGSETEFAMYLDAKIDFTPSHIPVEMRLRGDLAVSHIGTDDFEAFGSLRFAGRADFEVFEAEVEGSLKTWLTATSMKFEGNVRGKVGPFEGELPVGPLALGAR